MKILKALVVTVLVLLLAISPALADCSGQQGTVSIVVLNNDGTEIYNIQEVPWIEGATARVAMLNATNKEPSFKFESQPICPFGDFVTKVGDTQAGAGEFWALFINGEPSTGGIDTTVVNNGDVITWEIQPQLDPSDPNSTNSGESLF